MADDFTENSKGCVDATTPAEDLFVEIFVSVKDTRTYLPPQFMDRMGNLFSDDLGKQSRPAPPPDSTSF